MHFFENFIGNECFLNTCYTIAYNVKNKIRGNKNSLLPVGALQWAVGTSSGFYKEWQLVPELVRKIPLKWIET